MSLYTCKGSVRKGCGKRHENLKGAVACLQRDRKVCHGLGKGAYSNRAVTRLDGAQLGAREILEIDDLERRGTRAWWRP